MKTCLFLLFGFVILAGTGCEEKKDPRERPGFIDTSDPSSVGKTMIPPPSKGGKDATSLGGKGKMPGGK
jgi:hypothetical protein